MAFGKILVHNVWITEKDQSNTNSGSNEAERGLNLEITCGKLENVHKFENLGHSDLVTCVS